MLNQRLRKIVVLIAVAAIGVVACGGDEGKKTSTGKEREVQRVSYDRLVAASPAHGMTNPVTRRTINKWIDTWNVKGQLAFTYIVNAAGEKVSYFVFDGPPVSSCAALTPTYKFIDVDHDGTDEKYQVPAPSLDGVYYSGGQCLSYYGIDATTGQYLEFSIGGSQNYLLSTQPLPAPGATPAGFTSVEKLPASWKQPDGRYVKPQ